MLRNPGYLAGPGRKYNFGDYRYGFNGKENDSDGEFSSLTHYDYGFRIYNPAVGRFLSVDPLTRSYPWYTPYQFAGNKPIMAIDLDGLEEKIQIFNSETGDLLLEVPSNREFGFGSGTMHVYMNREVTKSQRYTTNEGPTFFGVRMYNDFVNKLYVEGNESLTYYYNEDYLGEASGEFSMHIDLNGNRSRETSLVIAAELLAGEAILGSVTKLFKTIPKPKFGRGIATINGTGRFRGVIELGNHVKSNKAFLNLAEKQTFDFVYDFKNKKFAVLNSKSIDGGHDYLRNSLNASPEKGVTDF